MQNFFGKDFWFNLFIVDIQIRTTVLRVVSPGLQFRYFLCCKVFPDHYKDRIPGSSWKSSRRYPLALTRPGAEELRVGGGAAEGGAVDVGGVGVGVVGDAAVELILYRYESSILPRKIVILNS